jgi:uncharacterized membrane protein
MTALPNTEHTMSFTPSEHEQRQARQEVERADQWRRDQLAHGQGELQDSMRRLGQPHSSPLVPMSAGQFAVICAMLAFLWAYYATGDVGSALVSLPIGAVVGAVGWVVISFALKVFQAALKFALGLAAIGVVIWIILAVIGSG